MASIDSSIVDSRASAPNAPAQHQQAAAQTAKAAEADVPSASPTPSSGGGGAESALGSPAESLPSISSGPTLPGPASRTASVTSAQTLDLDAIVRRRRKPQWFDARTQLPESQTQDHDLRPDWERDFCGRRIGRPPVPPNTRPADLFLRSTTRGSLGSGQGKCVPTAFWACNRQLILFFSHSSQGSQARRTVEYDNQSRH